MPCDTADCRSRDNYIIYTPKFVKKNSNSRACSSVAECSLRNSHITAVKVWEKPQVQTLPRPRILYISFLRFLCLAALLSMRPALTQKKEETASLSSPVTNAISMQAFGGVEKHKRAWRAWRNVLLDVLDRCIHSRYDYYAFKTGPSVAKTSMSYLRLSS